MRRAIVTAVVGIGLCFAVFAAPAAAAPHELFGLSKGQPLDGQDFGKMKSTGVRTFRFALNWSFVQPHPGGKNFAAVDKLVGNLAARGIRPVPFIYATPHWVAKKPNQPPVGSSKKVQAWRHFLTLVVNRYKPGGTYWTTHPGVKPKPITAWQIWNEPTLPKFFTRHNTARKYGQLVKISDKAIRAASHKAKIVLAGLTGYAKPRAWTFLDKLYHVNGIKRHFDATALHPYAATIGQFKGELRRFRKVMKKHHDKHAALWLTEVGWGSTHRSRRWPLNKGLRGQKQMLQKSFSLVLHKRTAWHIQRVFWFDWRDPAKGSGHYCSFCASAGLLKHNHKPKPAYQAFRHFTR
jgi:polysaccharide biosynthesis protein PslG